MLLMKGLYRHCEKDNFREGAIPNSGYSISWNIEFKAKNKKELFEKIKGYHGITDDNILCQDGKIHIQTYEKELKEGWVEPTQKDIDDWKQGIQDLYIVDYSYQLYEAISE